MEASAALVLAALYRFCEVYQALSEPISGGCCGYVGGARSERYPLTASNAPVSRISRNDGFAARV
jgi:hypothetical protein